MTNEELKSIRTRLGLTQPELAQKIGVARNTITRWEMGIRAIPEPAARLVQLLDVLPEASQHLGKEVKGERQGQIHQSNRRNLRKK